MKQFRFLPISIGVSIALLFSSCGSGGENTATETTADSAVSDASAMNEPEPAAEAKPSNLLVIKFKVGNFDKWKSGYESNDSIRRSYGLTNYVVGRGLDDSNMVIVALKMDDVNKAKESTGSQEIKDRMKKGGVIGKPTFEYVDMVMDSNTPIDQTTRLMITHKVKDWDAWKKEFDSGKQARMDAGLMDRALGYYDSDNHMVSIVLAYTDKKKADDFIKSKDLKDKMTAAGVEGPPTFFYFNIVQRY